jgi:hypothetical protein
MPSLLHWSCDNARAKNHTVLRKTIAINIDSSIPTTKDANPPSPSRSNNENASLNSAISSSVYRSTILNSYFAVCRYEACLRVCSTGLSSARFSWYRVVVCSSRLYCGSTVVFADWNQSDHVMEVRLLLRRSVYYY